MLPKWMRLVTRHEEARGLATLAIRQRATHRRPPIQHGEYGFYCDRAVPWLNCSMKFLRRSGSWPSEGTGKASGRSPMVRPASCARSSTPQPLRRICATVFVEDHAFGAQQVSRVIRSVRVSPPERWGNCPISLQDAIRVGIGWVASRTPTGPGGCQ